MAKIVRERWPRLRVLLTTGFMVGPGLPETDGPPGAACLGRARGITPAG